MSRENDTSQEPWEEPSEEDGYEADARLKQDRQRPRSSQDSYRDTTARPRQRPGQPRISDSRKAYYYDAYGRPIGRRRPPRDSYEDTPKTPGERQRYQRRPMMPPEDAYRTTEPSGQRPPLRAARPPSKSPQKTPPDSSLQPPQPRISGQSRDEAYARLRQRPRLRATPPPSKSPPDSSLQPPQPRDEVDDTYPRSQRRSRPLIDPEVEEFDRPIRRSGARPLPSSPRQARPRRRSTWSALLIGCVGGIVTIALIVGVVAFLLFRTIPFSILGFGKSNFTKQVQQPLPITSTLTQLEVDNHVGNITVVVCNNPTIVGCNNPTQATLTILKKVQTSNNSDADKEFGRISVDVKAGNNSNPNCSVSSCLKVNATVPETSNGNTSDSVDLTIALPPSLISPSQPSIVNASTTTGNISVENFQGVLTLTDDTGNISAIGIDDKGNTSARGVLLAAGSCLQTHIGNVTFAGSLGAVKSSSINPCSSSTTNTPGATQNSQPSFSMKSGTGIVDVTLNTAIPSSTDVILDANVFNKGKINSEFNINIQQNADGSASYYGPLIPNTSPTALLTLTVNTGNINLYKA